MEKTMNALAAGERIRIYIQRGDGEVQEIAGAVQNVEIYQNSETHKVLGGGVYAIPTTVETRLSIIGNHYLCMSEMEVAKKIETTQTSLEWRCDHCGSVNLREHRKCDECNFTRPFLYGL